MLVAAYLAGRAVVPLADGALHAMLRWGLNDLLYLTGAVACLLRAVLLPRDRLAWALLGLGITAYLFGSIVATITLDDTVTRTPAAAHAGWVAFYPLAYAALVLLARATLRPFTLAFALDGVLGALALAAVVVAVAFPSLVDEYTTGELVAGLLYPAGDLLLFAFAAWITVLAGWRASAMWRALVVAFGLLLLGDLGLTLMVSGDGYGEDALTSAFYPVGMGLVGVAAWRERGRPRTLRPDIAQLLVFPAAAVAVALLVLVIGEPLGLLPAAEYVCFAVLVLAFVRMVLVSRHLVALQDGRRFQEGFEEAKIGMAVVDERLRWERVNPAMADMLGERPGAMRGRPVFDWTPERGRAELTEIGARTLRTGEPILGGRLQLVRRDGGVLDAEVDVTPIEGADGTPRLFTQVRDVSIELQAERHSDAVARVTRAALDEADIPTLMQEFADVVGDALPAVLTSIVVSQPDHPDGDAVLGASSPRVPPETADLIGRSRGQRARTAETGEALVSNDIAREDRFDVAQPLVEAGIRRTITVPVTPRGQPVTVIAAHRRADSPAFGPEDLRFLQAVANVLATALERAGSEADHRHRALHDPLTGLANRALLSAHLEHALVAAERQSGQVALLLVDLDRFKIVNDTMGHGAGDALLTTVADRLRERARGGDLVARLGGDEFVVVFDAVASVHEVVPVAQRLLDAIAEPVTAGGRELLTSASVGIVVGDGPQVTADALLRDADAAMYRAKAGGGGRYELFDAELRASVVDRLDIEHGLRRAVERGELEVHFQPIIDLVAERPTGFEALVRWNRPGHGLVPPAAFVGVAEETGLIVPVGRWVLREACRTIAALNDAPGPPVRFGVNLSARQINEDLIAEVRSAVQDAGLEPRLLTLEITESLLITDPGASAVLEALRELGVSLALDDFGTGFSSLSALQRHAVDLLKLDRTMVSSVATSVTASAIARAAVDMAQALGVRVVAEGIEGPEQLQAVRDLGCHLGQGYLFARPMPAAELPAYLREASWAAAFAARARTT